MTSNSPSVTPSTWMNTTRVAGRYRLSIVLCYAGFRIVYEISLERVIAHELFGRHRVTVVGGQSQLHNSSELTRAVHHSTYLVILSRIDVILNDVPASMGSPLS